MAGLERGVSILLRFLFTGLVWWFVGRDGGFGWCCVVWVMFGCVCGAVIVGFGGCFVCWYFGLVSLCGFQVIVWHRHYDFRVAIVGCG